MEHGMIGHGRNSGLGMMAKQSEAGAVNYPTATQAPPNQPKSLPEVVGYQRELYSSVMALGMRLGNVLGILDGNIVTDKQPGSTEPQAAYPEEAAPIAAIITRINNTQEIVNACQMLMSQIEQRLGG